MFSRTCNIYRFEGDIWFFIKDDFPVHSHSCIHVHLYERKNSFKPVRFYNYKTSSDAKWTDLQVWCTDKFHTKLGSDFSHFFLTTFNLLMYFYLMKIMFALAMSYTYVFFSLAFRSFLWGAQLRFLHWSTFSKTIRCLGTFLGAPSDMKVHLVRSVNHFILSSSWNSSLVFIIECLKLSLKVNCRPQLLLDLTYEKVKMAKTNWSWPHSRTISQVRSAAAGPQVELDPAL